MNGEEIYNTKESNLTHQQRNETKQKFKTVENSVIQLFQMTRNQAVLLREKPDEKSKSELLPPNTRIKIKKRAKKEISVGKQWEKIQVTTGEGFGKIGWVLKEDLETEEQPETKEVTFEKAQELFDELKNAEFSFKGKKANIPFHYVADGCYIRAHKMAKLLTKKGYKSQKIFLNATSKPVTVFSNYAEDVDIGEEPVQEWKYHVAPIINVQIEQQVKPYVIDPSLFEEPAPLDEWRKSMKREIGVPYEIGILPKEYYTLKSLADDAVYKRDKKYLLKHASKEPFYIMAAKIREILNSRKPLRDQKQQYEILVEGKTKKFLKDFSKRFPKLLNQVEKTFQSIGVVENNPTLEQQQVMVFKF